MPIHWIGVLTLMMTIAPIAHAQTSPQNSLKQKSPLQVPQTSTDVKITKNQTLTLEEAVEIAQANNQELQVAKLRVEQNRAALKEAKAAKFPFVTASGSLFRSEDANFNLNVNGTAIDTAEQTRIQQRTQANAQLQRQESRFQFQQQLQRLQVQLQRDADLSQQDNVNQQITELQQRAGTSATLPAPSSITPFSPFQSFSPTSSGNLDNGIQNTVQGNVTVNYNILTGGQRAAAIRATQDQLTLSELDVERIEQQLQLNVANDYYDLQEVRALLRVALSAVRNATETLTNTKITADAGLRTQFEVLQAEVQLANTQQNLTLAEGLQRTAQRQLAETLSLPPNLNIIPADQVVRRGSWPESLPQSIVVAQNNRVELDQILLQRDIAQERKIIALAVKKPRLTTFAGVSASASDVEQRPNNDVGFQGGINYNVGFRVNINAFDGGETRAQLQAEDENIKIAETQYDDQKNQIRLGVERGYYSLQENQENIGTAESAVLQAAESLELAQLRLRAGIGTQLDVIQAQTDLTEAEGNLISAILDYNRALAALARETSYEIPIVPLPESG